MMSTCYTFAMKEGPGNEPQKVSRREALKRIAATVGVVVGMGAVDTAINGSPAEQRAKEEAERKEKERQDQLAENGEGEEDESKKYEKNL